MTSLPPPKKFNRLADKHVLVIGGSSGIGLSVAEGALVSGAHVTISSSSSTRVNSAVSGLQSEYPDAKTQIRGVVCDLSKASLEEDLEALFKKVEQPLHHIVFTAGDTLAVTPLASTSLQGIIAAGHIRFFAPLLVAKIGSRFLSAGPESSIIFTTGAIADHPHQDWTVIAAYAAGLHGMVRNLAVDLKPIRVNLVSPGPVDTPLWTSEQRQGMREADMGSATGRLAISEDVAEAYLWLLRDWNATGTVARSDSGPK